MSKPFKIAIIGSISLLILYFYGRNISSLFDEDLVWIIVNSFFFLFPLTAIYFQIKTMPNSINYNENTLDSPLENKEESADLTKVKVVFWIMNFIFGIFCSIVSCFLFYYGVKGFYNQTILLKSNYPMVIIFFLLFYTGFAILIDLHKQNKMYSE